MKARIIATASAFMLLCAVGTANAQATTTQPSSQPQSPTSPGGPGTMGPGMMGPGTIGPGITRQGGMTDWGMMDWMGRGIMGQPGMPGPLFRIMFALMDSNGDGTVSLQEFQAAHERIFKAIDINKDGHLTFEEMQAFISGQPTSASPR